MTVYACSSNRGKLDEFISAVRSSGVANLCIEPLPGLEGIPPPDETGATFEENASTKAVYYSRSTEALVLADDSGLQVTALDGAPGIHSARYAGPNATDAENNNLLLRRLEHLSNRAARFVCVLALARSGRVLTTLKGIAEGEILRHLRGNGGFGYDPLFFYPPLDRTFAELTPEEKLRVSHRGHALRGLFSYLSQCIRKHAATSDKIG